MVNHKDFFVHDSSYIDDDIKIPRCKFPQRGSEYYLKTLVKEGASIGANATIICGNTIGRHALIAAGAVVVDNVPDYALMMGIPAKRKGWVCECGVMLQETAEYICSSCNKRYTEENGHLKEVE